MLMSFLWFCAAGYSFPVGIGCLLGSLLFTFLGRTRVCRFVGCLLLGLSWISMWLAAMPFPLMVYGVMLILSLGWSVGLGWLKIRRKVLPVVSLSSFMLIVMLLGYVHYSRTPVFSTSIPKITVIGDSISAGIGGHDEMTWPRILAENGPYEVINLAMSGATVQTALHRQVSDVSSEHQLVLLEIGGNDLFGPTPIDEFQRDLDAIISELIRQGHTVAMFELPLLPWQWQYGRVQRIVGQRHHVLIIPKRVLVSVFSQKGASSDLAHLTPYGHQLMAQTVERVLKGSY